MRISVWKGIRENEMIPDLVIEIKDFDLSHELCMGIRHGLFGAKADEDDSVVHIGHCKDCCPHSN